MKKVLMLTAMLAGVLAVGFSQTDDSWAVNNAASWIAAVNGIRNGGNDKAYTITVSGTVSIPSSTESTFGAGTGITVTIEGSGAISLSGNGSLLRIGRDQTLIVKDITLRGREGNTDPVVKIEDGGSFLMEGSALGFSQADSSWTVNNTASWIAAVNGIRDGGNDKAYTITVSSTFSVPPSTESTFGAGTGITVTMQGSGTVSPSGNGALLHIGKDQTLIVRDLTLRGREGNYASVVRIEDGGAFLMEGGAKVTGNTNRGVYVDSGGTFTMRDKASVSGNTASGNNGGGGVYNGGTFTMQGGTISGNTVSGNNGGGVYNGGTFTMQGGTISGNTARYGGGVYGTVTMQDNASVSGNTANDGGGVYGTVTMQDNASVSGNTANDGGGVRGTVTIRDNALISGNTANYGGGVYGTVTMQDNASVSGNTANYGGGVYGNFTMQDNASVSGNTASYYGGGVYVEHNRTFTMQGGTISGNRANEDGGGVYNNSGTFTKTGGTIHGSDAEQKLRNTAASRKGYVVYKSDGNLRNATADSTMNSDSYGFWLNDEVELTLPSNGFWLNDEMELTLPSNFAGTWKRANFNNTLTLTGKTLKISSSSSTYNLLDISGDSYTLQRSGGKPFTLTIKLTNGRLVISGDTGAGQNNWNGTWRKQ